MRLVLSHKWSFSCHLTLQAMTLSAREISLGSYIITATNQLYKYQTCSDMGHATKPSGFAADLAANQSSYFGILQTTTYLYSITNNPTPETDNITVINNVGAPTIYYFQKGGFCSHSWTNTFFHRGSCRRGGTTTTMLIERPDFYINPNTGGTHGYVNINRIDDNAFWQASKADYQKDENAADFNDETEFSSQMYVAQQSLAALGVLSGLSPTNLLGAAQGAAGMALSAAQYQHTTQKYKRDADIAKNAPPVSTWVPIGAVTSPNRLVIASGSQLTQAPRQNDVYAAMNAAPDAQIRLSKTSRNGTRVYVDWTNNGSPFVVGDYIFLRTEFHQIAATGQESWGGGIASEYYVEVDVAFQFTPDEGEISAFIRASNPAMPTSPQFYVYYLNKPKVVRIEVRDTQIPVGTAYWTRIDYEYFYEVQGSTVSDTFTDGGFTIDNIDGPYVSSVECSDIALKGTVITHGISNINEDLDLTRESYEFSYDSKSFHKGVSTVTVTRQDTQSTNWFFVSKDVTQIGRPCFNAGYYGPMGLTHYEGGDITNLSDGGGSWRQKTSYRYDVYGRAVRTTLVSPSYEGKKSKTTWTQYVGSSQFLASQGTPDP